MDDKLVINTAVLAGEIMLRSGAETYRVEDTMMHILRTSRAEQAEALVMMTGIVATISNPESETITLMRRVHDRGTNMNRIVKVNEISRRYCAGEITLEDAYSGLMQVKGKQYPVWMYNLATVTVPAGFAPLFGGGPAEIALSAAVGAVLALLTTVGKRLRVDGFILNAVCSFGIAVTAEFAWQLFPRWNLDTVIISSIMPLVPGVAITNAIRDTLRGDFLSGSSRILEAFMTAAAVALGAGAGMALMGNLYPGGGVI